MATGALGTFCVANFQARSQNSSALRGRDAARVLALLLLLLLLGLGCRRREMVL